MNNYSKAQTHLRWPRGFTRSTPSNRAADEPILLIHGEADNNSGTYPLQSRRYYNGLKGLGKTARLVMLPYESHGYRARESIMHMLWETNRWLETYVKTPPVRDESEVDRPSLEAK